MGRLNTLDDWLSYQESLHGSEIDLGLDRVRQVYQALFPQGLEFQVITVAGTNGKGSTGTFIRHILVQAGHQVGQFSSPHIHHYNERFSVNGIDADDEQIIQAFTAIEAARGQTSLTYFEFSTLAALLIFTKAKVDMAVLEVGLGGRLDSVNVVDPDVCVITNIAIDHTDYLGDTREQIGREKAGIMRANTPCVCADSNPPASLKAQADSVGATLEFVTEPYLGNIGLPGEHQRVNAALARRAAQLADPSLSAASIEQGIATARIPGRFEQVHLNDKTWVFDVAHNQAAVEVLAQTLKQDPQPTLAIFAALKDKNIADIIGTIHRQIDQWLLVPLEVPRAIAMGELVELFPLGDKLLVCDHMDAALTHARHAQYARIVIFGSFYTVALGKKSLDKLT